MNFLAPSDTAVTVAAEALPRLEDLGALWRELEVRASGSFFTSWAWIGAWLATSRADGRPPEACLLVARAGQRVVGLGIVGERESSSFLRRGKVAALHQSGDAEDDAIFIEYNDFLVDRRYAGPARAALLRFIADAGDAWRDYKLSGVTPALRQAVLDAALAHRTISERTCPWVDLTKLPPGRSGYLAILSRNTRRQVQQSLRLYENQGDLTLSVAHDLSQARSMLATLRNLHQMSWRDRKGHGGAFASARFERFVQYLVAAGVGDGSIQLLRVASSGGDVGCLLNFIHQGHAYAYQSGFTYREDNRYRPGLVAHALAIVHAREQGLRGYHFMAGEGRYKSSLANADEQLFWMTLRQDDLLSRLEDGARAVKHRLQALIRGN